MNRFFLTTAFFAVLSASAFAQSSNTPAVATPSKVNPAAPVPGSNSFTEAQAKERIEKAGFTGVTGLAKDGNGVWMEERDDGERHARLPGKRHQQVIPDPSNPEINEIGDRHDNDSDRTIRSL